MPKGWIFSGGRLQALQPGAAKNALHSFRSRMLNRLFVRCVQTGLQLEKKTLPEFRPGDWLLPPAHNTLSSTLEHLECLTPFTKSVN